MATQFLSSQATEGNSPDSPLADPTTEAAIVDLKTAARQFQNALNAVHHAVHKPSFYVPRIPGYVLGLYSLDKLHYSIDYMVDYAVLNARMLASMTEAARAERDQGEFATVPYGGTVGQ
jgi:hypothetical protein